MKLPFLRFELARTRLAFSGALLSALFLSLLALGARSSVRSKTFDDIDEELYTLAVALGSSFELEGLEESKRDTLKAGLEVNAFEFRLANHSAILFKGDTPVAASGNLMKTKLPGGITPFRDRPEVPFTAVEPYSGQNRACRFLVTHLQGKAQGATLVLFRWIGPNLRSLARLDRALAGFVVLGFLGTAAILAGVVTRALKTVEEVTATAEAVEATDLSRRVRVLAGGEEFRRLAAVINSLLERLDLAFRAQKRLIADAAHELKTPTAVLVGEAQEALRAEATPQERRESIETIERVARGLAREVDALLLLARGDAAAPTRSAVLDLGALAEEAVEATEPLGGPRSVRCTFRRVAPAWVHGDRAGLL
ncbi:MAG: HAMP domain-containing histidine kinase, partial [Acidobacteriota bacterium]|nr:HAMP domain-containing histidine kinase [Acidobacteriota bacterium]